jgi:chromosome partitioning protein
MKIIAVTNRKGGVGKSTMCVHIAAGMAARGLRVGLVDTDSQGHAAMMLGVEESNGLYMALIEKAALAQVCHPIQSEAYMPLTARHPGSLVLLPSSDRTFRIPYELRDDEMFLFLETLEQMGQDYALDVILIDTNPTLNMFDGAVYLAADGYIYVTECERLSVDGLQSALEQMIRFQKQRRRYLHRDSRVLGIIPNKMRANTHIHRKNIAEIGTAFPGLVWPPVTLRTAWVEAANVQTPVFKLAPNGQESRDAWVLVDKTMEALTTWPTNADGQ